MKRKVTLAVSLRAAVRNKTQISRIEQLWTLFHCYTYVYSQHVRSADLNSFGSSWLTDALVLPSYFWQQHANSAIALTSLQGCRAVSMVEWLPTFRTGLAEVSGMPQWEPQILPLSTVHNSSAVGSLCCCSLNQTIQHVRCKVHGEWQRTQIETVLTHTHYSNFSLSNYWHVLTAVWRQDFRVTSRFIMSFEHKQMREKMAL